MRVLVPSHLASYTNGAGEVIGHGETLDDVMRDLDARFKGLRARVIDEQDRVRPHVKFFVGGEQADTLDTKVGDCDVQIVAAFSGG